MSVRWRRVVVWAAITFVGAVVIYGILASSRWRVRDTPFMRQYARIHNVCSTLRLYAEEHPTSAVHDFSGKGLEDLAAAGILAHDDATYIRAHQIQFFGFDPTRIAGDVPVLESMFTNGNTRRRIVGYSDGSTVSYSLDARQ